MMATNVIPNKQKRITSRDEYDGRVPINGSCSSYHEACTSMLC